MPLPKRVKVGPFTYEVKLGGPEFAEDTRLLGHCDHRKLEIALLPGLADDATVEVLLHEILHACFNAVGQPLEFVHKDAEEKAVVALAPILLQVLRANPAVLEYLGVK